jgi:TATA-box binding protein (TBP) (component of TFIID and TFIIIB)
MLMGMRKAKPPTCAWLTNETYILPAIVNIVYTVTFESPRFKEPLNLVRLAQYMPNVKYRPPNFASVTIRLWPTTALLSMKGKLVLIRCTTRNMALFYSQYYRQLIERVPIIVKGPNPEDKPYVDTLEGCLDFSIGEMQNVVGNGVLPQDGVHLTRLLYSDQEAVDWDPGGFPNLIYSSKLPHNGKPYCANIAITGKIVLMGLDEIEDVYSAYKIMCGVVHDFEDPNVPSDPKERYKYRLRQLENDSRFIPLTEEAAATLPRMNDANFMENLGNDMDESVDNNGDDDDNGLDIEALLAPIRVKTEDNNNNNKKKTPAAKKASGLAFLLDSAQQQQQQQQEEPIPLLFEAAYAGQVENVRMILSQPGPDMADAAFTKNQDTGGYAVLEKLERMPSANHRQIQYLIGQFISSRENEPRRQ